MKEVIRDILRESAEVNIEMFKNTEVIEDIARIIIETYRQGKKLLIFGNGGSAASLWDP